MHTGCNDFKNNEICLGNDLKHARYGYPAKVVEVDNVYYIRDYKESLILLTPYTSKSWEITKYD